MLTAPLANLIRKESKTVGCKVEQGAFDTVKVMFALEAIIKHTDLTRPPSRLTRYQMSQSLAVNCCIVQKFIPMCLLLLKTESSGEALNDLG
ncbi:hypothetical protein E2320_007846 [Naja naja]|nr:hypothetical protein E2320_007846 [Naja naja]